MDPFNIGRRPSCPMPAPRDPSSITVTPLKRKLVADASVDHALPAHDDDPWSHIPIPTPPPRHLVPLPFPLPSAFKHEFHFARHLESPIVFAVLPSSKPALVTARALPRTTLHSPPTRLPPHIPPAPKFAVSLFSAVTAPKPKLHPPSLDDSEELHTPAVPVGHAHLGISRYFPPAHAPLSFLDPNIKQRSSFSTKTDLYWRLQQTRPDKMPKTTTKDVKKAAPVKRAKKDENKPKRALSAYMFFVQDWRARIIAENPDATFGEVGKLLGARWKEMPANEKKPYNDQAEKDKQRAAKEKTAYDAANGKPKKAKKAPVEEEDDDEDEDDE